VLVLATPTSLQNKGKTGGGFRLLMIRSFDFSVILFFSEGTMIFSRNKSVNNTFHLVFSAKKTNGI
jgi:hypothetical protein